MKFSVSIYHVIIVALIVLCLGGFLGVCLFNKSEPYNVEYDNSIAIIKARKDSVIRNQYRKIHELENTLNSIDLVLGQYEKKLDSLSNKKSKIKVVYKYKYAQIKNLSDTAIVSYWKKQFNDK